MSVTLNILRRRRMREIVMRKSGMTVCEGQSNYDYTVFDNPDAVAGFWRSSIAASPTFVNCQENFHVLLLTPRRRSLGHQLVGLGIVDQVVVHAREVFRAAVVAAAHAIIMIHNHPSGDPSPSEADIRVTRELIRAGNILKIEVLDHLIMGEMMEGRVKDYTSLRELGYFSGV